jgi:hypothetical protein
MTHMQLEPNGPVEACGHALIPIGRGFHAEMDADRNAYATKCAEATVVLVKAQAPDLAMAIEALAKQGHSLFIAEAIQILARIKTRAEAMGPLPFGTA